jgi:HAMP domain-containing protein
MADTPDLTLKVLHEIRDGVLATNERIVATARELGGRIDDTNRRLDLVVEAQIRTATEVAELRGEVGELRGEVSGLRGEVGGLRTEVVRQGDRLDNALTTGGAFVQALAGRVERLERHTGLVPAEP